MEKVAPKQKAKHKLETHKYRVWFFWRTMLVLAVLAVLYACLEYPYAKAFYNLNYEAERVRHEVLNPVGGVELSRNGYMPTFIGNEWYRGLTGCGISVHCPGIDRSWFVPVEKGKEQEFTRDIIRKSGYATVGPSYPCDIEKGKGFCGETGHKGDFRMGFTIYPVLSDQPPATNVEPKIWRVLKVSFDYDWRK